MLNLRLQLRVQQIIQDPPDMIFLSEIFLRRIQPACGGGTLARLRDDPQLSSAGWQDARRRASLSASYRTAGRLDH